jgi:hypothetical protein
MTYCLSNLQRCAILRERPTFIPKAKRLRGSRAAGMAYEKKVGKVLRILFKEVHSARWFEYEDSARAGVCQVDHFVVLPEKIILVECKLSETEEAWSQMADLYAPILAQHYRRGVARVQAARHLRTGRKLLSDINAAKPGQEYLWHLLV